MSLSAGEVTTDVTTTVVPEIQSHLETIATQINSTVATIAPALVGSTVSLTAEEAQALLSALADLESLVFSIKTTLSSTIASLESSKLSLPFDHTFFYKVTMLTELSAVVTLIQPEITTVLGLVLPLLGPVTTFVYSIANLVPGGDAAASQLTSAAGSVLTTAGPLLGGVQALTGVSV